MAESRDGLLPMGNGSGHPRLHNLTPTLTPELILKRAEERARSDEALKALEADLSEFYRNERRREQRWSFFWKVVGWGVVAALGAAAYIVWKG